ncbi:MAG TPA: nuclear transport factor 2 family protein [Chthoniobacterales bacterium]|nr:nuclear transport factor 2 family protein [Chthoniobacterales bacterium]
MKIAVLAATALFAAAVPFAFAQEESPSPAETASEKSRSSDPTVSVTTEKTVSPTPKPAASTSPAKSSSPSTKSSPSASPAPSSSTAAVTPTKKSTPEATIREIEDKWEGSVKNHDTSVAQAYLADDFRGVSSKGEIMNKSKLLSEIKKDTDVYSGTKNRKVEVRVFGGQFAVASGTSTEEGKDKGGQTFKRSFRWTDVWVLRKDTWQCVASQAMLVK